MSDTPETEAKVSTVPAEFAIRLERERDEARDAMKQAMDAYAEACKAVDDWRAGDEAFCRKLERERNEARYLLKHAQSALDAIHLEIGGWIKTMSVASK